MTQATDIQSLDDQTFDVIVIGAGINGAGVARDAAFRGLRVLLVDKTDVAGGTTSWASRLIHGGLRYLEHAELSLVRESLREREILLRIAPHLVHPLPLTIPIYEYHKRGPWMIRAGMVAYDALSYDKSVPRHRMFSLDQALDHEPGLNPRGLKAAARYYDAQVTFPERVAVENVLDAVEFGAVVGTHVRAERLLIEAGVVRGVVLRDEFSQDCATVRAPLTVNVAGPWVDDVFASVADARRPPRMIGGTKGTHIIVDPFPNAPNDALYIEARADGRPYFIIPWNDLFLIGTTDTRYDGDMDRVIPEEEEIAYLLDETNHAIPEANLTREDVHYAYAGIRPLPYQGAGATGSITRRHVVRDHAPALEGILSVIGGKLTTYRSLSGHVVDAAFRKLGRPAPKQVTSTTPLPGAASDFPALRERLVAGRPDWLSESSARYLARVYGARADEIVTLAAGHTDLQTVISPDTGAIGAAILHAFRHEFARTLTDAMLRRTMIGYGRSAGFDALNAAAEIGIAHLGWTIKCAEAEKAAYRDYMSRFLPQAASHSGYATQR